MGAHGRGGGRRALLEAQELIGDGRYAEALNGVRAARRRLAGPQCALVEGQALLGLQRPADALAVVGRALRRAPRDRDQAARLRLVRVQALWEQGRVGHAARELAAAANLATGDHTRGGIEEMRGLIAWRAQALGVAGERLEAAERLFAATGAPDRLAAVLGAQAGVLRDLGRLPEALAVQGRAVQAARASGRSPAVARAHAERASLLASSGRWQEAALDAERAAGLFRHAGDPREHTMAGLVWAVAALALGDLALAGDVVRQARQVAEAAGLPRPRAEAALLSSDIRLAAGDAELALATSLECLSLFHTLKDGEGECRSRVRMVHALLALGRRSEAAAEARRARRAAPAARADLGALAATALGRSLLREKPREAGAAFCEARVLAGDRSVFAEAARLGQALAEGAGREHPVVVAALESLEAWGDRRVLAYCLADIRAVRGAEPVRVPVEPWPAFSAAAALAALGEAAGCLLGDGPWMERWTMAARALEPALPWCRMALVGEPGWELRHDLEAPRPLGADDLARELAAHCPQPTAIDLAADHGWRRHPTRVLHDLGTALVAPVGPGVVLYADLQQGRTVPAGALSLLSQFARLLARQNQSPAPPSGADEEPEPFPGLVGDCPAMLELFTAMRRLARWDDAVHILGETGTGKERVAQVLHTASPRASGPYVAVNASSFTDDLFDSLMFGHLRGSFTGAVADREGHVGEAEGGTLFLDEVTDLSPRAQARLLRFLETKEYRRVGETKTRRADVRIVTASNVPLAERVARGTFRQDLVYRLERFSLLVPPLRERGDDLLLLARHFLRAAARRFGVATPPLGRDLEARLRRHPWPGNVRELENEMSRYVLNGRLDTSIGTAPPPAAGMLQQAVRDFERAHITRALRESGGNRTRTACRLGVSRQALVAKLTRWGLAAAP